jgi:hypothetical protein
MGWYYTLECTCVVLPEYLDFFTKDYMREISNTGDTYSDQNPEEIVCNHESADGSCFCYNTAVYAGLSKAYRDLIDIWISLDIGPRFYEYDISGNRFRCKISKKVNRHTGNLWSDLENVVKDILVPTSSEILSCKISSDDYGDHERVYTDLELRGGRLYLASLVRSVQHTWVDGTIAETRVIYKRGIPPYQQVDLERCYN